jgi:RNA polymerase-binding protein DksA
VAKTSKSKSVASSKGKGKPVAATRGQSKRPVVLLKKQVGSNTGTAAPAARASKPSKIIVAIKPVKATVPAKVVERSSARPAVKAVVAKKVVAARSTVAPVAVAKPIVAAAKKARPTNGKATLVADKPIIAVRAGASPSPSSAATVMIVAKPEKRRLKALKKLPPEPAYRPPLQESVPTNGKMRKNQAGLLTKELEHFRDLLLEKRREIVGDMSSMEREALRSGVGGLSSLPVHMADMGTDNYEQEFTLGLVEKDRNLLREINAALAKIQNGTYGLCEGTGNPINKVRLEAQPWARYSIEHARQMERQRGIR